MGLPPSGPPCVAFLTLVSIAFFGAYVRPVQARGPEPALWKIKNGNSTTYLFGSVHAA